MQSHSKKGFTLIEFMIVAVILGILAAIIMGVVSNGSNLSFGVTGIVETRCIDGKKYMTKDLVVAQIVDAQGRAVECQ